MDVVSRDTIGQFFYAISIADIVLMVDSLFGRFILICAGIIILVGNNIALGSDFK
jgi:hypothetical protein